MGLRWFLCCAEPRKLQKAGGESSQHQPQGQDALEAPDSGLPQSSDNVTAQVTRKPTTGVRKPGSTAASQGCHPHDGFDFKDPQPNDYLYFGQPGEASGIGGSTYQNAGAYGKQSSTGSQSKPATGNPPSSGRDDSGFLDTGLNNQQIGYQHLTYGGSLQYDYAGTHKS